MPLIAGRYRLGETLGTGGMGKVWLARDEVLDRDVAIKEVLLPDGVGHPERRTLREARAAARLGHPNVVQVFDVFEVDGRAWIVMEYVPSRSLQDELRTEGPIDPRRAARIGLDLIAALRAAHAAGVDHRDVKPANVLLADDGRVLLTDFGIATIEGDAQISTSDMLLGSPEYMSPERAKYGTAGLASDLWSLGATLYAAVEGQSPFHRASALGTLTALAADEPDPPRQAGPLEPVLAGLLRKDPEARLDAAETEHLLRTASAGAYGHALVPAPAGATTTDDLSLPETTSEKPSPVREPAVIPAQRAAPVSPPPPPSPVAPDSPAPGVAPASAHGPDRRWIVALSIVVVVLVVAAVVWAVTRPDGEPTSSSAPPATSAVVTPSSAPATTASSPSSPSASPSSPPSSPPTSAATGSDLPTLPDGWRDYRDATGFALYVPEGWTRSKEGRMVYFRRGSQVLGIDQTKKPAPDPVADWRGKADYRVDRGDFPSYDEIRIDAVDYFEKAADWEFTFTRGGTRQHVNNRGVVTSENQAYGIYWQTRDADWSSHEDDLQLIFDSFRPAD
ncbi:serine/threonine protein kinase [Actinoplanes sp. LDG1-06]|uniref:non-specific serine/threonine protein kinase n=1 Tax=Paractinoplanes ovalisporus TaxID=2810368 RepID=A0ABS2AIV8_9ACTN|nr:serine/threonine-protein kinase [Actinoplanes ovalisporus]MBM2619770.1 serine/threonine protein kinase [Actinoplanes ovalisporus]